MKLAAAALDGGLDDAFEKDCRSSAAAAEQEYAVAGDLDGKEQQHFAEAEEERS